MTNPNPPPDDRHETACEDPALHDPRRAAVNGLYDDLGIGALLVAGFASLCVIAFRNVPFWRAIACSFVLACGVLILSVLGAGLAIRHYQARHNTRREDLLAPPSNRPTV